ncbi:uncharacterized protein [Typha angustifolia]|uniref:uncharacterized protein isoform X2 n=1 Tax=Typha angustifolia TaxID=59011 RepID=UPI003C2FFB78
MAALHAREATPPPVIGKAGRLTVFITPPPTPRPSEAARSQSISPRASPSPSPSPRKASPLPVKASPPSPFPVKASRPTPSPPVQVPPQQFEKPAAKSSGSFGFFWDAVAKVQDAHSSLDEYLADWFGLNQSKYQWALNDYYENNGKVSAFSKEGGKSKEVISKEQAV